MTIVVEDGTGVAGAESYAAIATIDAYWTGRTHNTLSTTWADATTAKKEGAAREATAYTDATWGTFYKGDRRGYVQGLLWPRTKAWDEAGFPLPSLPQELVSVVCELSARALLATLAADVERGGDIKRQMDKVGALETETEYFDGALSRTQYGAIAGMLSPILNGSQPDAAVPNWAWA